MRRRYSYWLITVGWAWSSDGAAGETVLIVGYLATSTSADEFLTPTVTISISEGSSLVTSCGSGFF